MEAGGLFTESNRMTFDLDAFARTGGTATILVVSRGVSGAIVLLKCRPPQQINTLAFIRVHDHDANEGALGPAVVATLKVVDKVFGVYRVPIA